MQPQAVLTSLQEQEIEDVYIEDVYKEIDTNSLMTAHLHKESNKINTRRGVRQGDTISPKLFTAALERIFGRLTWGNRGLKIDGEYLSHLRFADDIHICANTPHELQQTLQELADESDNQGLKMNKSKTNVMMETDTTLRSRTVKATSTWDRDTAPEIQNQDKEIQKESRPDGQHSPSFATSSRV